VARLKARCVRVRRVQGQSSGAEGYASLVVLRRREVAFKRRETRKRLRWGHGWDRGGLVLGEALSQSDTLCSLSDCHHRLMIQIGLLIDTKKSTRDKVAGIRNST
jgi:hypothetical protein